MRPNVDYQKIERLMQVLGGEAQGSVLRSKVENFIERFEGNSEEEQS
ncbi:MULTISPECIES: hypothetical protein [unclassified Microcoleus]